MDEGDRAKQWADQQIEDALAAHRRRHEAQNAARSDCETCGEEIAPARRRALPGCRLCIDCQRMLERNNGRV